MNYALAGFGGGAVAALVLLLQHYFIDRSRLKRQHAYMLGVTGLDVGFVVFALIAGLDIGVLIGAGLVEMMAGGAVILAYKLDGKGPPDDKGQLQETLNLNEELRAELGEAQKTIAELRVAVTGGPVRWEQLLDMFLPMYTAMEHLSMAQASMDVSSRRYYKLANQAGRQVPGEIQKMNAARLARKAAAERQGQGQSQKENPDVRPGKE